MDNIVLSALKILHFTNQRLPDRRVEKGALTSKNRGSEVFFAGKGRTKYENEEGRYVTHLFSKTFPIDWTPPAIIGLPYYWNCVKKQIRRVLEEIRPDIVHAHNVFPAKMISELNIPFVYDDAEYWSQHARVILETRMIEEQKNRKVTVPGLKNLPMKMLRKVAYGRAVKLWTNWERELVSSVPTLTVSEQIVNGLKRAGNVKDIFVVPNFPMKSETGDFVEPVFHDKLSSVYAGADDKYRQATNRDISGLTDLFTNRDIGNLTIIGWEPETYRKIKATGFLPRRDMYKEMFQNSIGLIPWKKHWSHYFVNPNKAYEYAHAGLLVMSTSDITPVIETLGDNCITFEDFDVMASKLEYFRENMDELYKKRINIFDFAHENLIWENFEKNIIRAYQLC